MSRTPLCWETCSTASAMPTPASPEPRRYRGALIGAGGIARQSHLPALRGAPALQRRLEVVALVDSATDVPPVDTLPLLARREQLADLGPLDFIDICTPTASHLDLTLWGLERGYHVVCEKPVALTRVEADRIGAAARATQCTKSRTRHRCGSNTRGESGSSRCSSRGRRAPARTGFASSVTRVRSSGPGASSGSNAPASWSDSTIRPSSRRAPTTAG